MTIKNDIAELTSEKLEEIRQRYRQTEVPKCHICGAEMTIQRISASRITYGCAGDIYDETGCHYAEGRSLADDHYAESRITVVDVSDPDVLDLVEALEKVQQENTDGVAGMAESYETTISMLRSRIAELESFRTAYMEWSDKTDWVQGDKRFDVLKPWGKHRADVLKAYIEHLESRTVKLPDFRHERFNSDWGEHDAEAYQVVLREALVAAGIKWEAE